MGNKHGHPFHVYFWCTDSTRQHPYHSPMKTITVLLIIFAVLITTKQVVDVNAIPVQYEQICREDTYNQTIYKKLGILQFPDGTIIKDFIKIEQVPSCP
jgi:hypothetical protein